MEPRSWHAHVPPGVALSVGDLTARGSLPAAWAQTWARAPAAPVLLDVSAAPRRWVSAGELDELTRRAAGWFWRVGLVPGDRVLWSTRSSIPAVVAHVGALRAGLVVVPANPAYTARQLTHIVTDVRPAGAVVDDPQRARIVAEAASGTITVVEPDLDVMALGGAPAPDDAALDASDPAAPALVAYTSGTTGAPKGAVLSHANVLANSESVAWAWRWTSADRLVHALPIFHGHGLCVGLYTSLLMGASAVLLPKFDVGGVLDASAEYGASLFFGVPTMYHRLTESPRLPELARLRLAVSGSAALSEGLHRRVARGAGVTILERYGMTETLMTLSNPYAGERRAGTVGFPFPGVEARIEEPRTGEGGEIVVRGPSVFAGYWERPASTAGAFSDGWFRTGDLAVVEDGYVRILGRATEMIVSGGFNVYPAEVEDVLLGHPSVREVAVTGTPSEEWGEVVTAWVVLDDADRGDTDGLLAYAAERLAPYKRPRVVHYVDGLPRNSLGKVRRSELS